MSHTDPGDLETDPRFPSGPWTGFFLQQALPGRHRMELRLTFRSGQLTGEGRDRVGPFVLRGRYDTADGRCRWTKRYIGKHDVTYQGFNEGKGIWGVWEIPGEQLPGFGRGGFHIWPEGTPDPTQEHLTAEAELPLTLEDVETGAAPALQPAGSEVVTRSSAGPAAAGGGGPAAGS